jgi:hypothetical protein
MGSVVLTAVKIQTVLFLIVTTRSLLPLSSGQNSKPCENMKVQI